MESTPHKIKLELEDELNGGGSSRLRNVYAHKAERRGFDDGWKAKLDEVREYLRNMGEDDDRKYILSLANHGLIISEKGQAINALAHAYEQGYLLEKEMHVIEKLLGEKIIPEDEPVLSGHKEQEDGDEEVSEDIANEDKYSGQTFGVDTNLPGLKRKIEKTAGSEVYHANKDLLDYLGELASDSKGDIKKELEALLGEISLAPSREEVFRLLKESRDMSRKHQAKYPDGKVVTQIVENEDGEMSQKLKRIVRPMSEDEYEIALSKVEPSDWKKRLNKVRDFLRSVSSKDKTKKQLGIIADLDLRGASIEEATEVLNQASESGLLPKEDVEKVENILGARIDIPTREPVEMKYNKEEDKSFGVDESLIHKKDSEPVANNEDDAVEQPEVSIPIKKENIPEGDSALVLDAKKKFSLGRVGDALVKIEKIKDEEILANVVRDIVIDCVNNKDFQNARRFISKIKDEEYRVELGDWLQSQIKIPKINIRQEVGDLKYNRVDTSFEKDGEQEEKVDIKEAEEPAEDVKPKVDEELDLPLTTEVETVEPAVDLDLNIPEVSPVPEDAPRLESLETVDLEKARDEYAKQYAEYKNKVRSKRGWFAKHLADLGFDKQLPESEKPDELKDAERAYIEAKKKKNESLFSATVKKKKSVSGQILDLREVEYDFNPAILEEAEKEFSALQEKIQEGLSPQEKSAIARALDAWPKMGKWQRRFLSTAMLTTGNVIFGTLTIPAAATYAGLRLGSAVGGAFVAQGAGFGVEKYFKNKNEKDKEEIEEEYSMELNEENFAEREKEIMQNLESEIDKKKRQRLVKAGVMAGVGGLATYGIMGNAEHILSSSSDVHTDIPETPDHPIDIKDMVKDLPAKNIPSEVQSVEVPVSSRGFIETMRNLKEGVIKQYGNIDNVPDEVKRNLLDHSDVELAKKMHMYDPGNNLSGIGYKGETIGLDSSGNVVYHHLDGKSDVLLDTKTGLVQHFDGPMAGSEVLANSSNTQIIPPIDFEGGKIYVLKDVTSPNAVNVLLDGKEIGKGVVDNGIPKLKIDSSLKGSWFQADNVYERALKAAKSTIKNSKITV